MAVQVVNLSAYTGLQLPLEKSRSRKCPRGLPSLSILCLAVLTIIATAQAQTFQYSRGWTNGKRSGLASPIGLLDLENGYLNPEMSELSLLPGHLQMNLSPQARLRTLDYNQYLARKLGVGNTANLNTRKQPLWFGTIMGMDSADSAAAAAAASSQTSTGTSNSSPSGSASDF